MTPEIVYCALLGLIAGSFFNVLIVRIPKDESIGGRSRCPSCGSQVAWFDNVPVLSYLWLLGKCRRCHAGISVQYPLVEILSALLFVLLYLRFGLTVRFATYSIFCSFLLILSIIDLHHRIIPDIFSVGGIPLGILNAFVTGDISVFSSIVGLLLGGGSFFLVAFGYEKLTGREGLGGGDIKLLAMIGAWLGVESILPVLILSSFVGSFIGITYMLVRRGDLKLAIPFGPFLASAAALYLWKGDVLRAFLFR